MTLVPFALSASLFFAAMPAAAEDVRRVDPGSYVVETVATGLERPWSVALLPDGRKLVTERPGRLKAIGTDGTLREVSLAGLPPISTDGVGGLMDVVADPDFPANGQIFLTAAYDGRDGTGTSVMRAKLVGDRLEDVVVIFRLTPTPYGTNYGGRLAFMRDGAIVLTLGDASFFREEAQNPANHLGKLVRIDRDGHAPPDNPFVGRPGAAPEILTLGHRNVQGIAVDPEDGSVLASEHGPRGGDEINVLRPGANYGWPIVTGGLDYSFARVTPFRELPGFERPLVEWTPSIAPGGLAVYSGPMFPDWRGDLLVPMLKERSVRLVRRREGRVVAQELLLSERGERMRDVRVARDGSIYVLTDGPNAALLRLVAPARAQAPNDRSPPPPPPPP